MAGNINLIANNLEALKAAEGAEKEQAGQAPAQAFEKMFDQAAQNLEKADETALQVNTGGPANLHDAMIAMEKADISLRLMVQVRNKAVDAYKEIMRMQV
ncbi:MAG TPA: flagellar hook-basal body complex protein FliE [Desulfosalsimonadaceae bacterium]|nr:flagellar hook-basal body complex protein FliE [Desulfosalsimonadaceae bacterium]